MHTWPQKHTCEERMHKNVLDVTGFCWCVKKKRLEQHIVEVKVCGHKMHPFHGLALMVYIYIDLSHSNELLDYFNCHLKKIVHSSSVNIAV